jgi:heme/copper-type cytochrome/quinol oxidase subunit 2
MIASVLVLFLIVLLPLTTKLTFFVVVFSNSSHDDGAHVTSHGNMFGNVAFIVIVIMAIDFFS